MLPNATQRHHLLTQHVNANNPQGWPRACSVCPDTLSVAKAVCTGWQGETHCRRHCFHCLVCSTALPLSIRTAYRVELSSLSCCHGDAVADDTVRGIKARRFDAAFSTAFAWPPTAFPLPFLDIPRPFHRLRLAFHCLYLTFPPPSTAFPSPFLHLPLPFPLPLFDLPLPFPTLRFPLTCHCILAAFQVHLHRLHRRPAWANHEGPTADGHVVRPSISSSSSPAPLLATRRLSPFPVSPLLSSLTSLLSSRLFACTAVDALLSICCASHSALSGSGGAVHERGEVRHVRREER